MSGRLQGMGGREVVEFSFEGEAVTAYAGDSIAMALWAAETSAVRGSSTAGEPRGVLCNMGICYECLVVVDGETVRSCTTEVRAGMQVAPCTRVTGAPSKPWISSWPWSWLGGSGMPAAAATPFGSWR